MSRRADPGPARLLARLRALALALLLAASLAPGAGAQDAPAEVPSAWETTLVRAKARAADPNATTPELEALRDQLLRMRSAAIELEAASAIEVTDVKARLETLGPAPADGATETDEVAQLRAQITAELSASQGPLLEAQDFHRRALAMIRDIDRIVRARFTDGLTRRGPTPLRPAHWWSTIEAVTRNLVAEKQAIAAVWSDPEARGAIQRRVPIDLALASVGIALTFGLRRRLVRWVEAALSRVQNPRAIGPLIALRNFSKLIVPLVGAGLLFAALDPAYLTDPVGKTIFFDLPAFLVAIIAASWLGSSVFAPRLAAYRLAPVSDDEATVGAWLTLACGGLIALHLFLKRYVLVWDLTSAEVATVLFPLVLAGGVLLWQVSRVLRTILRRIEERDRGAPAGERAGAISRSVLEIAQRGTWAIAFLAPLLAAAGFLAAAGYLLYSSILTLALVAAGVVLFDLITTTIGALGVRRDGGTDVAREGLVPVLIGSALIVAGLPVLALIWGARSADIANFWFLIRDGMTYGGMRISPGMILSFVLVFMALYGLSRVLQSLLRNTVLPRTRMDAGGKDALVTGVGYVGFFIASVVAVSSTGIDLTSLAFVAGALSVGIGFGLQNIVSNFVSGIILLVERPIKQGDWIEVGGFSGYVRGISVRSTEIETFDRASVILPNSDLVAGSVLNRTHTGLSGRLQVPVTVGIESDPRQVEAVLLSIAEAYPLVLTDPSPRVLLLELGPDALMFEIRCWLRDVNFSLSAKSDINFTILERFAAEGIRMQPFARDVRLPPDPPPLEDAVPPPATARVQVAKNS